MADITGLSVTVIGTQIGDQLVISSYGAYCTQGSGSNVKLSIMVDGALVRPIIHYGYIDGNPRMVAVEWVTTLGAGDITGGNTIVKVQWCKYSAGSVTCELVNRTEGVGSLSVLHIRT
jgi:hypothetical protein